MKNKSDFTYSYSAPTSENRKEIESIRSKYLNQATSTDAKFNKLKKLDNKVKNIPTTIALAIGIVGLLIFGLGISMILEWKIIIWGVVVSLAGFSVMIIANPIFKFSTKKLKEKYSAEILKLSEELLNNENKNNQ